MTLVAIYLLAESVDSFGGFCISVEVLEVFELLCVFTETVSSFAAPLCVFGKSAGSFVLLFFSC